MGRKIRIQEEGQRPFIVDESELTDSDYQIFDEDEKLAIKNKTKPKFKLTFVEPEKNNNIIPSLTSKLLDPKTEEYIKETGGIPIRELEKQGNKFVVGALGGAGGGLGTALGGGILNVLLGEPSETFTDAATDIAGGLVGGSVGNKLANMAKLGSIPRQAMAQGAGNAAVTGATGATKSWLDAYLDPERKVTDAPMPTIKSLAPSALLGLAGGGASQYARNRMKTGPVGQSTDIFNEMMGEQQTPPGVAERMKEIQQGKSPNAANTLTNVIDKEKGFQRDLALEMDQAKVEKALSKDVKYQELEKNKQELAKTIIEQRRTSPRLAEVNTEKFKAQSQLQEIYKQIKNAKDPNEISYLQEDLLATNRYLEDIDTRLSQIKEEAEQLAIDRINRKHNSPEFEGKQYPENQAAREANTAREQAEKKLIELKRQAFEGFNMDMSVTNLIKSSKTSEDLVQKLIQADPIVIKKFMDTAGKNFPDIKESVIGEILRQSWDGKTFTNFSKMYGDEGTGGNLGIRLATLLDDPKKAYRVIDSIALLDKGLKTNNLLDKGKKALMNMSALTLLFKVTGVMGGQQHGTSNAALAAGEVGTMTALSIPKLIDTIMTDKKKYETFKKWADSGFNSKLISMSEPFFQSVMDLGDHYTYDENGEPKLTGKKAQ